MSTKAEPELTFDGTGNEFLSLEEKIYRTIELLKHAREAKAAAERDVSRLRVEKMLAHMDALIEEEQA